MEVIMVTKLQHKKTHFLNIIESYASIPANSNYMIHTRNKPVPVPQAKPCGVAFLTLSFLTL